MGTLDGTRIGYVALSLTNYNSTSRPAISAGSLIEVAGTLFRFSTEEAISTAGITSTAENVYYIRLVPSSSECSAQFSTTAGVWREDLQGYYQSTTSNDRVLGATYFTGSDYISKHIYSFGGVDNKTAIFATANSTTVSLSSLTSKITGFTASIDLMDEWSTTNDSFTVVHTGHYDISFEMQSSVYAMPQGVFRVYVAKNGSTLKESFCCFYNAASTIYLWANLSAQVLDYSTSGSVYEFYSGEVSYASSLYSRYARHYVKIKQV